MSTFNPNAGGAITLADGATFTKNFRAKNPGITNAVYFGAEIINRLLAQSGGVGIRMYNAIDGKGITTLVMVAVDVNGNDLFNGVIADLGATCPSVCDAGGSPLLK
jgi:hypothetical protein